MLFLEVDGSKLGERLSQSRQLGQEWEFDGFWFLKK